MERPVKGLTGKGRMSLTMSLQARALSLCLFSIAVLSCANADGFKQGVSPPRAEEASDFVWSYLRGHGVLPVVVWLDDCTPLACETCCSFYVDGGAYVWDEDGAPLWETSLTHELIHAYLDIVTGTPDPEHSFPEWQWVRPINRKLKDYLCQAD